MCTFFLEYLLHGNLISQLQVKETGGKKAQIVFTLVSQEHNKFS